VEAKDHIVRTPEYSPQPDTEPSLARIVDDSMAPRLLAGDSLIVGPPITPTDPLPEDNTIVLAQFTPESGRVGLTIAAFFDLGDGNYLLRKENPEHPPIRVRSEEIDRICVAIERRQNLVSTPPTAAQGGAGVKSC